MDKLSTNPVDIPYTDYKVVVKDIENKIFNDLGINVHLTLIDEELKTKDTGNNKVYCLEAEARISTSTIGIASNFISSIKVRVIAAFADNFKKIVLKYNFDYGLVNGGRNGSLVKKGYNERGERIW